MKGLLTSARTLRSARICVISPGRCAMCALRIVLRAYIRCVSFFRTCITFPKLPLPITLSSSKASIVSGSFRDGLKSILRWNDPAPAVALYHWSEACFWKGRDRFCHEETSVKGMESYMSFQERDEIYPRNEEVVAHVVMAGYRRAQVS